MENISKSINKIWRDETKWENLMRNQIFVTTFVMRHFNDTIQKLQMNEATFNKDMKELKKTLQDIKPYFLNNKINNTRDL